MPTIEIDYDELRTLIGREDRTDEELEWDLFNLGIEYEGETEAGLAQLEFEADRLDRVSIEGLARSLRYQYGDTRGVTIPKTNAPEWTIEVEESVPETRPYVTGAIARNVSIDDRGLESLIQLQEKLHATMGRKRAKGAIGVHDLTMLKGSAATDGNPAVRYVGVEPEGDRFVPLDSDEELTPAAVLESHPKGEEFAHLVREDERYPAIYDDLGLFSFPPVINGRRSEVSSESRDLFIEMTGTDQWTIDKMLAIVCYALAARGATIEEVTIQYPDHELVRPDFEPTTKRVSHERIESVLGVAFETEAILDLAERSGLDANPESVDGEVVYEVTIPPYRVDVLHPIDVVDDIGRAYGFNDLEPRYPDVATVGTRHDRSRLERSIRTRLVGLGFEDLLNFHMISETENFDRLSLTPEDDAFGAAQPATIREPYSEEYTSLRTWVLPSLLMVLENNTHRAYPQDLAEIGFTAHVDPTSDLGTGVTERRHVAGVIARHDAAYEDAKARLQALTRSFGVSLETPPTHHPTFIEGRAASVVIDGDRVGVLGELHPEVIVEHDLEVPVAAFEFELRTLD